MFQNLPIDQVHPAETTSAAVWATPETWRRASPASASSSRCSSPPALMRSVAAGQWSPATDGSPPRKPPA
jgi:hypothetical protein